MLTISGSRNPWASACRAAESSMAEGTSPNSASRPNSPKSSARLTSRNTKPRRIQRRVGVAAGLIVEPNLPQPDAQHAELERRANPAPPCAQRPVEQPAAAHQNETCAPTQRQKRHPRLERWSAAQQQET